jgi:hypothetical protein
LRTMRPVNLVKGFLSALGLTGALVVTGYIIESAYQQLLGTMTGFLGTTAYIASASDFLLDLSLLLTQTSWWKMVQILAIGAGVLLAGFGIRRRQAQVRGAIRPWRRAVMVIISIAAAANFYWYILPLVTVQNVLYGDLKNVVKTSDEKPWGRLGVAKKDMWLAPICGHMPEGKAGDMGSDLYRSLVKTCTDSAAVKTPRFQDHYAAELKSRLIQNLLNVCWLAALSMLVFIASGYMTVRLMDWETMLAFCLLAVNLAGLPFQYGKTLRVKPCPFVSVWLAPELLPAMSVRYRTGMVLYDTDSGCTLVDANTSKVWFVPKEKITAIETHDSNSMDVIAYYIEETLVKAE